MIPEKIGRYNIEKELGRGGMAVVYLATDPFMSREVALKVLPRQFTFDPQFKARFQREAQVIAKLDHPAIVPVFDFGEHDEQPYIVMRYMKGGSLADQLKEKGPFLVDRVAEILKRIGSALDEAHEQGIVHRDLKPGNILFDDRGDAFVADFGIVKMSEATIQYTGNAIIGTPGYMSPEQARGDDSVDGRSDIYSLGAIAYEMLTGKLPYQSDTPMGLVMKHILEPVPDLMAVRPDLPTTTGVVISTAMAKEPGMRYQTCSDIAKALSNSATLQMSGAATRVNDGSETVLESPVMPKTDMAGTVVETPSYAPRSQTVPPATGGMATGGMATGGVGTGTGYTAEPEKKKGGIPTWAIGAVLLIVVCVGGVIALGGFGLLASILGNQTPTVAATATSEVVVEVPSPTPETADPEDTPTPESNEPTPTTDFNLVADTPTAESVGPVGGGSIGIGDTLPGALTNGQVQEWTFTAEAGSGIDIQVQPDDDFDLTFDVLNSARQSIVPGGEVDLSFGTESVTNLTIPTSGTYVIAVKGFDGTSGGYILTLNRAEPSAGSIVQASDTLNDSSEHLFPFNSTSGGVTVVAVVNPDDDLDVILGIYNDDTDTLLEEIDETFSRETLTFVVPSAGNYYFKVTGFESATGNYEISMTGPPEVAFVLANRDEVQGSFGPTSVLEYYYSGELGDIFTVSVLTADDIDLVIEIYEDGDTLTALAEVDDNLSGGEEELTFTLPAEGLYIIRIREFFGEPGTFIMNIR